MESTAFKREDNLSDEDFQIQTIVKNLPNDPEQIIAFHEKMVVKLQEKMQTVLTINKEDHNGRN